MRAQRPRRHQLESCTSCVAASTWADPKTAPSALPTSRRSWPTCSPDSSPRPPATDAHAAAQTRHGAQATTTSSSVPDRATFGDPVTANGSSARPPTAGTQLAANGRQCPFWLTSVVPSPVGRCRPGPRRWPVSRSHLQGAEAYLACSATQRLAGAPSAEGRCPGGWMEASSRIRRGRVAAWVQGSCPRRTLCSRRGCPSCLA